MEKIKFGTDGWRGIIADSFTIGNLSRIAAATSVWLLNKSPKPKVIIGYDTRFGGKMFAETVAKVLAAKSVQVLIADDFVTTPMVSLAVLEMKANLGIMITASHNSYQYNGFKLKGQYGGPLLEEELKNIEDLIPEENAMDLSLLRYDLFREQGMIRDIDLEKIYYSHARDSFPLNKINESGLKFAFDAMYGSGQKLMKKFIPGIRQIHCSPDPLFNHISPEPLENNLQEFVGLIRKSGDIDCGLAIDGDGDRLVLVDKDGTYIDSHRVILILIHYLAGYKKQTGKIVTGFSSTSRVEKLAGHYGLKVQRVKIGFKAICRIMLKEDVLVGGEESGGISIKSYIPERDGIWMGLTIFKFLAETGKSLKQLMDEIESITGSFACLRRDVLINREQRNRIMDRFKNGAIQSFGSFEVKEKVDLDGHKFFFSEDTWLLVRLSGTEPLIRCYAEASTKEEAEAILEEAYQVIMWA